MNTIADELGIIPENFRRWIIELEEKGDKAFPGNGNVPDSGVIRLQKELDDVKEENYYGKQRNDHHYGFELY